jgi:hypothetical protein
MHHRPATVGGALHHQPRSFNINNCPASPRQLTVHSICRSRCFDYSAVGRLDSAVITSTNELQASTATTGVRPNLFSAPTAPLLESHSYTGKIGSESAAAKFAAATPSDQFSIQQDKPYAEVRFSSSWGDALTD